MQENREEKSVMIKMLLRYYEGECDLKNLLAYIAGEGKNMEEIVGYIGHKGLPPDYRKAAERIIITQKIHMTRGDRRAYHLIISFPPEIYYEDTLLIGIGKRIAEEIYKEGHAVYFGLHLSKKHKHLHYAIASLNYKSGKKWHKNKKEFLEFKNRLEAIISDAEVPLRSA